MFEMNVPYDKGQMSLKEDKAIIKLHFLKMKL